MRSLIGDLIITYVIGGGGGEAEGGIEKEEYSIEEKKMLHEHDEDAAAVAEEKRRSRVTDLPSPTSSSKLVVPLGSVCQHVSRISSPQFNGR